MFNIYIIKASMPPNFLGLLTPKDAYTEVDTIEEATAVYSDLVEKFPSSIIVQVFDSVEIEMPPGIREKALQKKEKQERIKRYMNRNGIDFLDIVDADGRSNEYSRHD